MDLYGDIKGNSGENLFVETEKAIKILENQNNNRGLILNKNINLNSEEVITVIVEFNQKPIKVSILEGKLKGEKVSLRKESIKVDNSHKNMRNHIKWMFNLTREDELESYINYSYRNSFNGIAIKIPSNRIEELLNCSEVKAVYSNEEIILEPIIGSSNIGYEGKEDILDKLGVINLHNEGIKGDGVKVAILDTGIDYNHPDLKDAYKGGYDFINGDTDPMETTYEEWQKSGESEKSVSGNTYYTIHGTHVAGILVGKGVDGNPYSKEGVAPNASLYVYKVLGKYGTGTTNNIIAGIEKAMEDGMDIISLSLGANINNQIHAISVAINNAVLSGIVAVVSAGNSGSNLYSIGSPGTSALAISVGASDLDINIVTANGYLVGNTEKYSLRLLARNVKNKIEDLNNKEIQLVDIGYGLEGDYLGKDVAGKAVIATRGRVAFNDLIIRAKIKGVSVVIIQNNDSTEGHIPSYLGEEIRYIETFSISKFGGDKLRANINKDSKILIKDFSLDLVKGDKLAKFSSRGPVATSYEIKPEIVAPGVAIYSCVPEYGVDPNEKSYENAYRRLSGTSMAAPYVAGVAALILSKNKSLKPIEVKSKIMNTAVKMNGIYSVYDIGAGRVNPYNAVKATGNVSVKGSVTVSRLINGVIEIQDGDMNFGLIVDLENDFISEKEITIKNNTSEKKNFKVKCEPVSNVQISKGWSNNKVSILIDDVISVEGNSSRIVKAAITIPKGAEFGSYEGYIIIENIKNVNESYRVPFVALKLEQGNDRLYIDTNKIATPKGYESSYFIKALNIKFSLSAPMQTVEFRVLDGNSDEELGVIVSMDASTMIVDNIYSVKNFDGRYYPYTGDEKNPISNQLEILNTGNYKLRLVSINSAGQSFNKDISFYIDNKLPEIKEINIVSKVGLTTVNDVLIYEYDQEAEKEIELKGNVYDEDLDKMLDAGIDPFSRPDFNNYYKLDVGLIENNILVQRDGSLSGYIYPDLSQDINEIKIKAIDVVGNQSINDVRTIYLVKKNTQYAVLKPENIKVKSNDLVNIKVKVNNILKTKEVLFKYKIDINKAKIIDVTLLPDNIDKASIEYSISIDSNNYQIVSGKVKLYEFISGEKELINIKVENNSLNIYRKEISLEGSTSYINESGNIVNLDTISIKYITELEDILVEILPYWCEGLTYSSYSNIVPSLGSNYNYSNIGLNVKVNDNKGNEYPIIYNNEVNKFVAILPLETNQYTLTYDMPGHFIINRKVTIDRIDDLGGGYIENIQFERVLAGDINKDNVIDINDAIVVRNNYLSTRRDVDINYDAIVDMKDMNYIIQNYLTKNPNKIDSKEPVEEKDGEVLQDIINSLKNTTVVSINPIMNLKGESTQTAVILTWDEPAIKIGLTGYIIYREGKEIVNLRAGTVRYVAEGLKQNTIYGFKVVVKYVNGNVSKAISINIRTKK